MWRCVKLWVVIALLLGATSCLWADAINLPAGIIIQMKFQNWDVGSLYTNYANGTYGEADLHGSPPAGVTITPPPSSNPGEDGWGIFSLTGIERFSDGSTLWAPGPNEEVTGIFWGLHDWQMIQTGPVGKPVQEIRGRGLQFAFYYDNTPDFKPGDPTTDRVKDGATYLPFFKGAGFDDTDGLAIWTGHSVPGFIADAGVVDPLNEFVTTYTVSTGNAMGGFYGDLGPVSYLDGSGMTHAFVGVDNEQFQKWIPGDPAYPTYFEFQFTGRPAVDSKWLLKSNDPITGLTTPELPPGALFLLGLVPLGWRRLRSK